MVNTISRQLLRGRSAKDKVTLEASVHNLYDDLFVGETDHKAVLGCVVLVFRLRNQAFAGIVLSKLATRLMNPERTRTISLTLPPATVLDLEAREVRVRLDLFDEWHGFVAA